VLIKVVHFVEGMHNSYKSQNFKESNSLRILGSILSKLFSRIPIQISSLANQAQETTMALKHMFPIFVFF
jgi:hypothetical protein